jgi:uncharacterized membrane protein YqhA
VVRPRVSWDVCGARKLILAVAAAALLTWIEWEEHHPPEIALVAVIHFVFVCAAIALAVYIRERIVRSQKPSGRARPG